MGEGMFEDLSKLWEFPSPPYGGLLAIGEKLFIFESGVRIGIGKVVAQNDDRMLVLIEFTEQPRFGPLYYGTLREAAGLEDAS